MSLRCLAASLVLAAGGVCIPHVPVEPDSVIGADSLRLDITTYAGDCGLVTVLIHDANQVTATYGGSAGCERGQAIIAGSAPSYATSSRRLTLPVRVVNRSPDGATAPVFVALPGDSGRTATTDGGVVTPVNADSTIAAGRPDAGKVLWRVLTSGDFGVGDTTPPRAIQLTLPNKATQVRLVFVVHATVPDTARPPMPDGFVYHGDVSRTVPDPSTGGRVLVYSDLIGIVFEPSASGTLVRSTLAAIGGTIVGGAPRYASRGAYQVRIPPRASYAELKAEIDRISDLPGVDFAWSLSYTSDAQVDGRYPTDGPDGTRTD